MIKQIFIFAAISLIIAIFVQCNIHNSNFSDGQEIDLNTKLEQPLKNLSENYSNDNSQLYDLNENLTFKLQSFYQYVQLSESKDQILPFMVSIKSKDQTLQENIDLDQINKKRPGIDLVCVIDNSGSMNHEDKINLVKNTLMNILDYMNEDDRISLITFNSYSTILTNLIKVNESNKKILTKEINLIRANGGTNISNGMKEAFNVLLKRKYKNPITSIFLLSDGQDNESKISVRNLLNQEQYHNFKNEQFTINSFGYGKDHDSRLMSEISNLREGSFYYIKDIEKIDEFFADAFGGLVSVIAQNITINVNINKSDPIFQKYFSSSYISKTYGDSWKEIKKGEQYQIKINQLISGVSKDFVFEITVPKSKLKFSNEHGRSINLLNADLNVQNIENQNFISKKDQQTLQVFGQIDQIPDYLKQINLDVEFHHYRVQVAQTIKQSINDADDGNYDQAEENIIMMSQRFTKASPQNQEKLKQIELDLKDNLSFVAKDKYKFGGRHSSTASFESNSRQNSVVDGLYSNDIQKEYVKKSRQKRNNIEQQ